MQPSHAAQHHDEPNDPSSEDVKRVLLASIKGPGYSSISLVDLFVPKIKLRERERERYRLMRALQPQVAGLQCSFYIHTDIHPYMHTHVLHECTHIHVHINTFYAQHLKTKVTKASDYASLSWSLSSPGVIAICFLQHTFNVIQQRSTVSCI